MDKLCNNKFLVNKEDRRWPYEFHHVCGLPKGHKLPPDTDGMPHQCFCNSQFKREWLKAGDKL